MVRQLHGRDFAQPPGWVRKFTLASIALVQITPIFVGGLVLSRGSPTIGRVLFAVILICSGGGALVSVYRDWRYREPYPQSPFFLASIPLLGVAALVHFLSR